MNKDQVINLAKLIGSIYSFVNVDKTYLTIWYMTTKHADYEKTINRFYQYISDPANRHQPPLPADIVVNVEVNELSGEKKKIAKYEEEARKDPPTRGQLEELKRMMQRVSS